MPRADRDDDDDDRPRPRRRRDRDDDPPAKSGPSVWLILGIVFGAMVLVCGGVGVFVAVSASQEIARRQEKEQRLNNSRVNTSTAANLKAGMTLAQVEQLLGPGETVQAGEVNVATAGSPDHQRVMKRWQPAIDARCVLQWRREGDSLFVAFSADPKAGGTVVGSLSHLGGVVRERVRLGGELPSPDTLPPLELTADELFLRSEDDDVIGRRVIVTGKLDQAGPPTGGRYLYVKTSFSKRVRGQFDTAKWPAKAGELKAGDQVKMKGKLTPDLLKRDITLVECELITPAGE